ncbi:hypothetical protein JCM14076_09240 [Methylosoma difficile]
MKSPVIFLNSSHANSKELSLYPESVLFHGDVVDERGESAVNFESNLITDRVLISYDSEKMLLNVNGVTINADRAVELFIPYLTNKNIILEATTLTVPELFFAVKSLISLNVSSFLIIYVEPKEYKRERPAADSFALTEQIVGYKPIPDSILDLSGNDVEAGVFFLGFEPDRLERALEEYQMISSKDLKLVFGIPAFQPGWELNSIVPHLEIIGNCSISYCAANDPSSAYESLEETRSSLMDGNKMFVAPIGTKPCGIASAIFASLHPSQVGLLYDHRKKKGKRSEGVSVWHRYYIKLRIEHFMPKITQ